MTYIERHTQGTLALQFPELRIEQQGNANPIVYVGNGLISQKEGRALFLTMLIKAPEGRNPLHDIFTLHGLIQNAVPGQPFPAKNFFRVEGTDLEGNNWRSENLLITPSGPHALGYFEITARIDRIHLTSDHGQTGTHQHVRIHIPTDLEIPPLRRSDADLFNRPIVLSPDNAAAFEHKGRHWSIENQSQWIVVTVFSEDQTLPIELASEICYALTFSFGQEFRPAIIEHFSQRERSCQLISYQEVNKSKHRLPPLNDRARFNAANFWRLFRIFADAIEQERGAPWPSIVQASMGAVRISQASLEAKALVLCVEIESLVKAKLMQLHEPRSDVVENLKKLEKILVDSELPEDFTTRVKGITGAMKSARAQDILHLLVKKGVLTEAEVKTWKSLRDVSAHGARTSKSIDIYIQQVHQVHSLLHKLIFLIIGYQGHFTDYGAPGWIDHEFTSTLSQTMLAQTSAS